MRAGFTVFAADAPHLEELYAEVQYYDEAVAVITQEEGYENLDVELLARDDSQPWKFKLKDFEEALEMGRQELWRYRLRPS